jgi:hypothetical protein
VSVPAGSSRISRLLPSSTPRRLGATSSVRCASVVVAGDAIAHAAYKAQSQAGRSLASAGADLAGVDAWAAGATAGRLAPPQCLRELQRGERKVERLEFDRLRDDFVCAEQHQLDVAVTHAVRRDEDDGFGDRGQSARIVR